MYLWELGRVEVYLLAKAPAKCSGGWAGGSKIDEVPDEVKAHLTTRVAKIVKDNLEYEALSPEENIGARRFTRNETVHARPAGILCDLLETGDDLLRSGDPFRVRRKRI